MFSVLPFSLNFSSVLKGSSVKLASAFAVGSSSSSSSDDDSIVIIAVVVAAVVAMLKEVIPFMDLVLSFFFSSSQKPFPLLPLLFPGHWSQGSQMEEEEEEEAWPFPFFHLKGGLTLNKICFFFFLMLLFFFKDAPKSHERVFFL